MNSTATHTAGARRWFAGALIALASAAALLPGTASAQEKHWGISARHHTAPYAAQHWNGVRHSVHHNVRHSASHSTHHGWHDSHHARRPQPGHGALWHGARPAGGRSAHGQGERRGENGRGWHGKQPGRAPVANNANGQNRWQGRQPESRRQGSQVAQNGGRRDGQRFTRRVQ